MFQFFSAFRCFIVLFHKWMLRYPMGMILGMILFYRADEVARYYVRGKHREGGIYVILRPRGPVGHEGFISHKPRLSRCLSDLFHV